MEASSVPIGQTITVVNNTYIRTTFTRTGHNEGIIEQFDPMSGRLVLKAQVEVFSGSQFFEFIDTTFWSITLNGQPVAGMPDVANARVLTNPETRTVDITTR
jgi:hypothetical protein